MSAAESDVKPGLQPAIATGPGTYQRWRGTTLGRVTEALEQRCTLDLIGPVEGRRVLDLGCGDGVLTAALAERGARAIGIDVDRAMLDVAAGRGTRGQRRRPQFIEGRIEQLPLRDGTVDAVVAVTVLCLVADRRAAVHEAARVLRPGGRMVIGDLGRWNVWAAKRRLKGWFGSKLWRAAHFTTADELCEVVENAGLTVESIRGSVFYPPSGILARWMAPLDTWLGSRTCVGAAFIAIAATK
jgi:ubiquinone/menaquinone biosynthesis C-methylase UbiE